MPSCPTCGSKNPARLFNVDTGVCLNVPGCRARRCQRRKDDDNKRFKGTGVKRVQCHATTGELTVLFCELGEGHTGLHVNATREWGGNYEAPLAAVLRAGLGT
jgi:hypothetical protein